MLVPIAQWQRGTGMRKALNPEIVLGFLAATVLWIGVLGWQASYAPTDSEKRQCEETAAKTGHKAEECKTLWERTTSDPVAFFTFWLVISTVGLGVSTVLLWRAGEKQLRHARRSAAIQSRDMRESIRVAEKSADVGLSAINLSQDTAERQLRAYITSAGAVIFAKGTDCRLHIKFVNSGQTPAYKFQCWYNFAVCQLVGAPPFDNVGTPVGSSVVGAGEFNHIIRDFAITSAQKEAITDGLLGIFVWGRVTYQDAFRNSRFLHFQLIAVSFTRAIEFDSVKGYGWSLSIAGYHTDEYPQT
jgi:hypothetical protein